MKNGIINVKKEAGMTSHDVVFKLRRILQEKKIGHGGTLDPDVVGVLPIAVGKATRVIEYMTEAGKVYEGEVTLGFSTTTEDASGEIIEQVPVSKDLTEELIDATMKTFIGEITQIPPMYSAVKVNGRKLYEYARAGQTVERPERQVTIYQFERTSPLTFVGGLCRFSFKVACSKGTYVRTLAVDLGEKLDYPSHMSKLMRTASAGLTLDNALTLSEIEELVKNQDYSFFLPISLGVSDLAKMMISESEKEELSFGRRIVLPSQEKLIAAFFDDQLVAVLEQREDGYKPKKVLL
ncbi:MAG: tRNA pseudouridine(55) synthase TruB [Streptococcus parauberis]|uniref:tRNA pseudouridine(55) synthase TruB n=1 Tax=Streptococcus parauberis TaxID=1348 RepID=UPI0039AFFA80